MDGNIAAFFDFDETLLEVESGRMGVQWLKDHQMLSLGFGLKIWMAHTLYRRRLISEDRIVKIMLTFYRKRRLAYFQRTADDFYGEYLEPHLAPEILKRLDFHRKEGHLLVLISGSVRYWLEPVVKNLGFDHLLSTDLEVGEDGLLTGRPKGQVCVGKNKRGLALELAQETGIHMGNSYAYGNHENDVLLLEMVGHPYVVEPTLPLRAIARQRSWPILSFR